MEQVLLAMTFCLVAVPAIAADKEIIEANERWLDAVVSTNMSLMEYAQENHDFLKTQAKSFKIEPNAGDNMAEWRYYMPDGKIISCLRGMYGNNFSYECKEF